MDIFTVSFFGHREFDRALQVEARLEAFVSRIIKEHGYVEFLVGRKGEFDLLSASVIRRVRRSLGVNNCSLVWVMPYLSADYAENSQSYDEYYDEIEVCEKGAAAHFKSAIGICNRYMADRSDLAVFYVERNWGGAYEVMKYALKRGKPCINLYEDE